MRDEVGHGHGHQAPGAAADANDPPIWKLGSRMATRNVQTAREVYLRCAESTERVLNRLDATASQVGETLWAMTSGARDSRLDPRGNDSSSARDPYERAARLKAKVVRGRADFRDIALRGQIAADTNVRAYLDHLDDLATASSARHLVSAQTSYVWDQWQRSLQQACDLQQRAVGALRKIASAPTA